MENQFLQEAKALYKDRIRIVLSALIIVFSITFFLYYTSGIAGLGPIGSPEPGISRGFQKKITFFAFFWQPDSSQVLLLVAAY